MRPFLFVLAIVLTHKFINAKVWSKQNLARRIAMFGLPVDVYGTLATIVSVLMVFIGLPKQIRTNYRHKSCNGLDKTLFILVLFAYGTWALYGGAGRNAFLLISNIPGFIFSIVICVQMWIYRGRKLVSVTHVIVEEGE